MSADYVCVGDVTRDLFFFINEASVSCDINKENCQLTLRYGEKIPVEKIGQSVGGNAANVAAGLAKLSLKTKLVTAFGDDDRGAILKRELLRGNVDLEDSLTEPGRESNTSSIIVFQGERTILTYHADHPDPDFKLPPAKYYYLTSSSGRDSHLLYQKVLDFQERPPEVHLAFNPSNGDLRRGKEYLPVVLKATETLILNWEEAELLLGTDFGKNLNERNNNAKTMLTNISSFGPKYIAITDGPGGAFGFSDRQFYFVPPSPDAPFETTGAGDAFASGFLAALTYNNSDIQSALAWGAANAGSVITKIGAQEGLLSKVDIESYLSRNPALQTQKI